MSDKEQTWVEKLADAIYCQEAGISPHELISLRQLSGRPDIRIQEIKTTISKHRPPEMNIEWAANEIWGLACNEGLDSKEKIVEVLGRRQKAAEQFKEEPLIHLTPEDTVKERLAKTLQEVLDEYIAQTELSPKDERALEEEGLGLKNNFIVKKAKAALAVYEKEKEASDVRT